MPGDYTICTAMSGNGSRTGIIVVIRELQRMVVPGKVQRARAAWFGAAASTLPPTPCGRRFAATVRRAVGTTTVASASAQFRNPCLFYPFSLCRFFNHSAKDHIARKRPAVVLNMAITRSLSLYPCSRSRAKGNKLSDRVVLDFMEFLIEKTTNRPEA